MEDKQGVLCAPVVYAAANLGGAVRRALTTAVKVARVNVVGVVAVVVTLGA